MINLKFHLIRICGLWIFLISIKKVKSSGFSGYGNFYYIHNDTDITNLTPMLTYQVGNNPTGTNCLLQCNREVDCNAVSATGLICNMYAILKEKKCITNYNKVKKVNTKLFIKAKRGINKPCTSSNQCYTEFGMECIKFSCQCTSEK